MFILVAWIHCFVYISNDVVTRGYIHLVFTIFVLESMLLQVVQVILLLVVLTVPLQLCVALLDVGLCCTKRPFYNTSH